MSCVERENMLFMFQRFAFSPDYSRFVYALLTSHSNDPSLGEEKRLLLVQLATKFYFFVLARSRDHPLLGMWSSFLWKELYSSNRAAALWFLGEHATQESIKQVLFSPSMEMVRDCWANLSVSCILSLTPPDSSCWKEVPGEGDVDNPDAKCVVDYVSGLLGMMKDSRRTQGLSPSIFTILLAFADLGPRPRYHLLEAGMIVTVGHLLSGNGMNSFIPDSSHPAMKKGDSDSSAFKAYDLLSLLVCSCVSDAVEKGKPISPYYLPGPRRILSEQEREAALGKMFVLHAIRRGPNLPAVKRIIQHWMWEDDNATKQFIALFKDLLARHANEKVLDALFDLSTSFLDIKDSLVSSRVDTVMSTLAQIMSSDSRDRLTLSAVERVASFLTATMKTHENVKEWAAKNRDMVTVVVADALPSHARSSYRRV